MHLNVERGVEGVFGALFLIGMRFVMTITLELSEEQARRLRARAEQRGRSLEEVLVELVDQGTLSPEEWSARLRALPHLLPRDLPSLPDAAVARDAFYRE